MNRIFALTFFLYFTSSVSPLSDARAQEKSKQQKNWQQKSSQQQNNTSQIELIRNTKLSTDFSMRGASFTEGPDEAQFIQLVVNPKVEIELHKTLTLKIDASLSLNSSRVQTRFEDPSLNNFNLSELVLSYNPNTNLNLSAGAIDQKHLNAPMLVQQGRAFPGAMLSYDFNPAKNLNVKAKAQFTIPNSTSLETDRTGAEATPSFLTQGFELKWKPKKWFSLTADVNHFTYSNLPSIVAFQSGRLGNEVIGENQAESFFLYDFDGFSQTYQANFRYSPRVSQFFNIQTVDNLEAPSDRRRSQWISTGVEVGFKNFSVTPQFALFFAESDSAPALYSQTQLGRNNRDGQLIGAKFDFKKLGFFVETNYINSDLIEPKAVQADLEYLELFVGIANVKF